MTDKLIKLLFSEQSAKAEVLHMDQAWQKMIEHQQLAHCVSRLLGQMTAAAVLLASGLKFDGALVVQIQGDGPVKLAMVEVRTGLLVRATAQLRDPNARLDDSLEFTALVNAGGQGRCAVILDMASRADGEQPYQGVVPMDGDSIAQIMENYMAQSAQLPTFFWLAADTRQLGGLMLQHIASTGGTETAQTADPEALNTLHLFANTVKESELLELDPSTLAEHLFWEQNPRLLQELTPAFACRCSQQAIEQMVRSLGAEQARDIVAEKGAIEVRCEFCGRNYVLTAGDLDRIFQSRASL